MEYIKTNQEQVRDYLFSVNNSESEIHNVHKLHLNDRILHITGPLELCLCFTQFMDLVLLSHKELNDGSTILATFSKVVLNQIESEDDILYVAFAVRKSSLVNTEQTVDLRLYLLDDDDFKTNVQHTYFSLQDWFNYFKVNRSQ
ncbi:TPA: hypothetical protein N2951_001203 [Vibrio parahaemolyticus]|nr:hypothetical protein [Vibrio parahaemolyticus]